MCVYGSVEMTDGTERKVLRSVQRCAVSAFEEQTRGAEKTVDRSKAAV